MRPADLDFYARQAGARVGTELGSRSTPTLAKVYGGAKHGLEVVVEYQVFRPAAYSGGDEADVDATAGTCSECSNRKRIVLPLNELRTFHFVMKEGQNVVKPCVETLLLKCHIGRNECFTITQSDCAHKLSCLEGPSYPVVVCHLCVKEFKPITASISVPKGGSILQECLKLKESGNLAYRQKDYHLAKSSYRESLALLRKGSNRLAPTECEAELEQAVFVPVYLNLAACELKLKEHNAAARHCNKVLARDIENLKAHYRLSEALIELGDLEQAKSHVRKLVSLSCSPVDIGVLRKAIDRRAQQDTERIKAVAQSFIDT